MQGFRRLGFRTAVRFRGFELWVSLNSIVVDVLCLFVSDGMNSAV